MITVAESSISEPILWNNYEEAEKTINDAKAIGWYTGGSLIVSLVIQIVPSTIAIMAISANATAICTLAIFTFSGYFDYKLIDKPLHKYFYSKQVPGIPLYLISLSLPILSKTNLLASLGLIAFAILSAYSSHLQTKGLTQERFLELGFEKLKEIMASEKSDNSCLMIDSIGSDAGYPCIYLRPELFIPSKILSEEQILELLLLGYKNKKLISYGSTPFLRGDALYLSFDDFKTILLNRYTIESRRNTSGSIVVQAALGLYDKYIQRCEEFDVLLEDTELIVAQAWHLYGIAETRLLMS